ncbi:TPA: hypothetical protein ACHHM1_002741 [Staphylococcus aureus]
MVNNVYIILEQEVGIIGIYNEIELNNFVIEKYEEYFTETFKHYSCSEIMDCHIEYIVEMYTLINDKTINDIQKFERFLEIYNDFFGEEILMFKKLTLESSLNVS